MIFQLVSKRLNLIVRVEQHLPELGNAVLQISIILKQIADKMTDDMAPSVSLIHRLGGRSTFQPSGRHIQLFLHVALPFDPAHHLHMMFSFLFSLSLDAFELFLEIVDTPFGPLPPRYSRSGLLARQAQGALQLGLFFLERCDLSFESLCAGCVRF